MMGTQKFKDAFYNVGTALDRVEIIFFICYFCSISCMVVLHCFAEQTILGKNQSPEEYSSFVNRLFFWWYNPVIMLGHRKPLTTNDVWEVNKNDRSRNVGKMYKLFWDREIKRAKESAVVNNLKTYTNEGFDENHTKEKGTA